ncbi:hypothetical protein CPAV1605_578 [seawater metagenome]|uniref:ATP-grasp domain-containing protein n=1 Tax=seawater metagenome TaxID=1561972 RepID=A0A5E8CHL3_9ZZZZ
MDHVRIKGTSVDLKDDINEIIQVYLFNDNQNTNFELNDKNKFIKYCKENKWNDYIPKTFLNVPYHKSNFKSNKVILKNAIGRSGHTVHLCQNVDQASEIIEKNGYKNFQIQEVLEKEYEFFKVHYKINKYGEIEYQNIKITKNIMEGIQKIGSKTCDIELPQKYFNILNNILESISEEYIKKKTKKEISNSFQMVGIEIALKINDNNKINDFKLIEVNIRTNGEYLLLALLERTSAKEGIIYWEKDKIKNISHNYFEYRNQKDTLYGNIDEFCVLVEFVESS